MALPDDTDPPSALPRGTRLGEFELRRVLGLGGFGIVYLAFDHALEREVAVKEYMPSSLVGRTAALHVSLLSQSHAESFSLGLRSFVNEARLLARFDHPSLVKVHRYWEANNTAYMAMPYYTGRNLHAVRRQMTQPPDEAWLRRLLDPLLGAIERLHREGVYHRDISPDNIILEPDDRPVLLDFGAARRVLGDKSMALTAILKPAYAPIEQYAETGNVRQGPWTDLYALGATLHYLLLGRAPAPATSRTVDDEMPPLAGQALPGCSLAFLQCIDWMLRPRPADRPQNVAALRAALAPPGPTAVEPGPAAGDWPRTQVQPAGPAVNAPAGAPAEDQPTVIDPSLLPATIAQPPAMDHRPTVVLTRQWAAEAATTIAAPPPARTAASAAPPAEPVPPPAPAARSEPGLADAAPISPSPAPPAAPSPTERPRPSAWRWPAVAGVAAAAGLALWLGLKPPPATTGEASTAAPPASATLAAAPPTEDTASRPDQAAASAPTTAAAPAGASAAQATAPVLAEALPGSVGGATTAPASAPPAHRPITSTTPATPAQAKAGPKGAAATPVKPPAAPTPAPAVVGGPPGLATSITRLPPAQEAAAHPPPAPTAAANRPAAADTPRGSAPAAPSAAPAPPPAATATVPAPPAAATVTAPVNLPAPAAAGTTARAATPPPAVARPAEREPEPVLVQARALSPSERCEGRVLLALWTCIERQCKNDAGLRDHPECVKLRREQEQRNAPMR